MPSLRQAAKFAPPDNGGKQMCEKCVELDGKIEHYQRLASRMTDQAMLDGTKELIEQMKALKAALHPEQTE